jgi:hypothetical protein
MARVVAWVLGVAVLVGSGCSDKDDDEGADEDLDSVAGGVGGGEGGEGWGDQQQDSGASGGTGSGGGTGSACEQFVEAWGACIDEFGGDREDYGLTDGYCDAYTDDIYDDLLLCYADALRTGDCSTVEGYTEAANEAAMCPG